MCKVRGVEMCGSWLRTGELWPQARCWAREVHIPHLLDSNTNTAHLKGQLGDRVNSDTHKKHLLSAWL